MKLPSLVALIDLFLLAALVMGSSSSDLISHRKIIKLNEKVEQIKSTATPPINRQLLLEKDRNSQRSLIDGKGSSGSSNTGAGGGAGGGGAAEVAAAAAVGASKDAAGDQYHGADMSGHHSWDAITWLNKQRVPPPDNN